jgi:hypothetical protein
MAKKIKAEDIPNSILTSDNELAQELKTTDTISMFFFFLFFFCFLSLLFFSFPFLPPPLLFSVP